MVFFVKSSRLLMLVSLSCVHGNESCKNRYRGRPKFFNQHMLYNQLCRNYVRTLGSCLTLDCGWKNSALAALGCSSYNVHGLMKPNISDRAIFRRLT